MRHWLLLFCGLLFCSGCSSSVNVHVVGQPNMNKGGNAAVVKFYQLTAEGNFKNTPLSAFWRDDEGALGSELVRAPRKVTVYPARTKTISLTVQGNTKYLGVAANLRTPDREKWRDLFPLKEMGNQVSVTIEHDEIKVEFEERSIPQLGIAGNRR